MTDLTIYSKIHQLPDQLKIQLIDYLEFLSQKEFGESSIKPKYPKAGCMKGTFIIQPGFDEPLEDFKVYMQ